MIKAYILLPPARCKEINAMARSHVTRESEQDEFTTVVSVPCIRALDVRKSAGKLPLFLKVHHFILYRKRIEKKEERNYTF